jgi:hypothetical protein
MFSYLAGSINIFSMFFLKVYHDLVRLSISVTSFFLVPDPNRFMIPFYIPLGVSEGIEDFVPPN